MRNTPYSLRYNLNHLAKMLILQYVPEPQELYNAWTKTQKNPIEKLSISNSSYKTFLLASAKESIAIALPTNFKIKPIMKEDPIKKPVITKVK